MTDGPLAPASGDGPKAGVAVITGGGRGVGRGIAIALGSHGYTVYVTGRTQRAGESPWGGTIHDTAAAITAAGGKGVAVRVDHRRDDEVEALFERVSQQEGRLDILVNNAALIHDALSGRNRAMTDDQLQQLLKDVQYLKDRQAILDVIMRHARGHDRHDAGLMNSCFWGDGVDEHGQFVTPGPEYGDWANKTHTAGYFLHMHNITNHTCEIDGDTAHCETYVLGSLLPRSAPGRAKFVSGRYLDRLERRGEEWRILVRRTSIEVEIEGDAKWPENEISETFPKGTWDTGDLSYARPLQLDSLSLLWDGKTHEVRCSPALASGERASV